MLYVSDVCCMPFCFGAHPFAARGHPTPSSVLGCLLASVLLLDSLPLGVYPHELGGCSREGGTKAEMPTLGSGAALIQEGGGISGPRPWNGADFNYVQSASFIRYRPGQKTPKHTHHITLTTFFFCPLLLLHQEKSYEDLP